LREDKLQMPCLCACCSNPIEPAQEFRFLVESDNLDDPNYLARIRRLPAANGRPVPVCLSCQERARTLSMNHLDRAPLRSGMLAVLGLLTVGWLVQSLVLGPRI
jgi:hypothetical protein